MEAITFNLDQDNRPLKENITLSSLEASPFKEQYRKSLSEIESYLNTLNDDTVVSHGSRYSTEHSGSHRTRG